MTQIKQLLRPSYGWTVERAISEPSFKGKNQTYKGASEC